VIGSESEVAQTKSQIKKVKNILLSAFCFLRAGGGVLTFSLERVGNPDHTQ